MDDLISRALILDEAKRISGPITGDGWDNWGVYGLIERQPSVPAVPLDKLCEWLEGAEKEGLCCLDCADLLRNKSFVTKWMEGLDGSESMVQKT